jgi:hypothetical protein
MSMCRQNCAGERPMRDSTLKICSPKVFTWAICGQCIHIFRARTLRKNFLRDNPGDPPLKICITNTYCRPWDWCLQFNRSIYRGKCFGRTNYKRFLLITTAFFHSSMTPHRLQPKNVVTIKFSYANWMMLVTFPINTSKKTLKRAIPSSPS